MLLRSRSAPTTVQSSQQCSLASMRMHAEAHVLKLLCCTDATCTTELVHEALYMPVTVVHLS